MLKRLWHRFADFMAHHYSHAEALAERDLQYNLSTLYEEYNQKQRLLGKKRKLWRERAFEAKLAIVACEADPMTDEEFERQRRSFAYGNAHMHNPAVTREMVDEAADRKNAKRSKLA